MDRLIKVEGLLHELRSYISMSAGETRLIDCVELLKDELKELRREFNNHREAQDMRDKGDDL